MTYAEFKQIVENTGKYYVTEDIDSVFVTKNNFSKSSIRISKNVEGFIEFNFNSYGRTDGDLIRAVLELAETPLDEREPEKKYYLKTKSLSNSLGGKFLAYYFFNDQWFFTNKDNIDLHKAEFTKKEIEEIKEMFDTDLKDFELIEVEE